MKLTKNLATIVAVYGGGTKLKKSLCKRSHCHDTPPSPFAYVCILMDATPFPCRCEHNN